jgi:nucleotide-binding universal stress UspA family protein
LFKKILVPIDGSKTSYTIIKYALDLAKKYSAKITIVTVVDLPSNSLLAQGAAFTPETTKDYQQKLEKTHNKILSTAIKNAKKINPKIELTKKLLEGRPADEIVELAKEEKFDLIVIGSRGLGGIKEFFLGSVSDRVADAAPCPVLIVKEFEEN